MFSSVCNNEWLSCFGSLEHGFPRGTEERWARHRHWDVQSGTEPQGCSKRGNARLNPWTIGGPDAQPGERRKSTDVHAFYILEIIYGQVYHQENYLTISSNHQKLKEIYPSFYIYNLKLSSIPGMKTKTIYIYIYIPIYLLFHLLINILYFYLVR